MMDLLLHGVSINFGDRKVLDGFDLTVPAGSTLCIMGPSGCGKTTLLQIISGRLKPDTGKMSGIPEKIAYVFQEDRLCEDYSAVANIRLILGKNAPENEIRANLEELGLSDSADMPVKNLSGGMKRRVAIARAICYDADLVLLDEPFKGLDENLRRLTMDYIKRHTIFKTVICVTHEPAVAEYMGGTVLNMTTNY